MTSAGAGRPDPLENAAGAVMSAASAMFAASAASAASDDWRSSASCRDLDPEIFFPRGSIEAAARQTRMARRTCRACPVQARCLEWALRTAQDFGVLGGLTEGERADRLRLRAGQPRISDFRRPPRRRAG